MLLVIVIDKNDLWGILVPHKIVVFFVYETYLWGSYDSFGLNNLVFKNDFKNCKSILLDRADFIKAPNKAISLIDLFFKFKIDLFFKLILRI